MTAFSEFLFSELPIVGILRGFSIDQAGKIAEAAMRGGLRNLEITMNTPGALDQIREVAALAQNRMNIGAGTVLNPQMLTQALSAGATFIVTPTLQIEVISECVRQKIPVFPGAFTPTEIAKAWDLGAAMVKIFPAEIAGPGYIRSIKAPFPEIKLLPTGGIDLETLGAYRKAGADGFGIGSPLFERARVEAADWKWIEVRCAAFARAHREWR